MPSLQTRSTLMCFSLQPVYLFVPGGFIRLNCRVCPAHTRGGKHWFLFIYLRRIIFSRARTFIILCACVFMRRGWPQMLASHWRSMLSGPGSYWTTPPWRQCWSFCASTRPASPQVCVCAGTESHTFKTEGSIVPPHPLSPPLVTTEQHCVSLSTAGARLPASHNRHTVMATGFRPVWEDGAWKSEPLTVGCRAFFGSKWKICAHRKREPPRASDAAAAMETFLIREFLFVPLSAPPFDWHLFLSESVHSDLNSLTLGFCRGAAEISEVRRSISLKGNRTAVGVEAASSQA